MALVDDGLRNALKWLSERRLEAPLASRLDLIDEAARRFDLTPLDAEFLLSAWREDAAPPAGAPAKGDPA